MQMSCASQFVTLVCVSVIATLSPLGVVQAEELTWTPGPS
jgi:hypothetical protein